MKPRLYDELIQTAVETSCFATGQSTIVKAAKPTWNGSRNVTGG